jgi:putative SOS response-associated peptidase YedK
MCYHASVAATFEQLSNHYQKPFLGEFPSFFSPTNIVGYHFNGFNFPLLPIISQENPNSFSFANWGLIPSWIKSKEEAESIKLNTLNAKLETLLEKPSFKQAVVSQRCLIPLTGFFEWQQINSKEKQPYFIQLQNSRFFSVAGLSENWINPENQQTVRTFSIVTTEANGLMSEIHNTKKRMPFILSNEAEQLWLNQTINASEILNEINLIEEEKMQAYKISKLISSKVSNVPQVLLPFIESQTKLF